MSVNEVKLKRAPVEFEVRGNTSTSKTFVIGNENHTLGNTLRHVLAQDPEVDFAGYSVPHPSEPIVHVRVQTQKSTSALQALINASNTLSEACDFMLQTLTNTVPEILVEDTKKRTQWLKELEEDDDEEEIEDGSDDDDDEMSEG